MTGAGTSASSGRSGDADRGCAWATGARPCRGSPPPPAVSLPSLAAGLRRDAVLKLVTAYFEPRRETLIDTLGAQLLADVIGYHEHRASIQAVLREELEATAAAADGRTGPARRAEPGRVALVDLLASWPDAPVEACVTVGSQAPLLYAFDAIPSMPYDERDPPHLAVPWLNVYDTRDFLSFVAEPSFRRTDGLASVVDLRVRTGKDFPKSHSAYWEQPAVWEAIATAFTWRRTERMTVREARAAGLRGAQGAGPTEPGGVGSRPPVDSRTARSSWE